MNDRELLELIAAQVGGLTAQFGGLTAKVDNIETDLKEVKSELKEVKSDVQKVKNQVTKIEIEHGKKLDALFDGYKQLHEKLIDHDSRFDTIESKIESQDFEIKVLKRAK